MVWVWQPNTHHTPLHERVDPAPKDPEFALSFQRQNDFLGCLMVGPI